MPSTDVISLPLYAQVLSYHLEVFLLFLVILFALSRTRAHRAIPGPVGLPFIGVALSIPSDKQWLKFHKWTVKYGDVVSITVMGQPTLILGSFKAASDLLDTKGTIYSDRPHAIMAGELVGWDRGLGYSRGPDCSRFRTFRRIFQQSIGSRACQDAHILALQEDATHKLVMRFIRDPKRFDRHLRDSTSALILRLAYGYEVPETQQQGDLETHEQTKTQEHKVLELQDHKISATQELEAKEDEVLKTQTHEDPLIKAVEVAMQGFAKASEPGTFWVDNFPLLRYAPEWLMPGGGFKAVARRMRRELDDMYDLPFNFVRGEMAAGRALPSFTSTYLQRKRNPTPADEELIKAAAASLYSGGADTTTSSMTAFILAMTHCRDVQRRAQSELDAVLGPSWSRLPTFADRARLPYISAIVLEVLRWNPAVPLGLAHRLVQDDVYRGHAIPQGTVVWANIWSMLRDPAVFARPEAFLPERYLRPDGTLRELARHEDPSVIGFGFGRRICPGMFFAMNSIFIGIATMLYVFDISGSKDESGREVLPAIDFRGFISHPVPFECEIVPRSQEAVELVTRLGGEEN